MLIVWFFAYKKLAQFAVRGALPPRRSESPVCATNNKPSCVLHLLGWFIGSRGFSSLERRPEFWVLQKLRNKHSRVAGYEINMQKFNCVGASDVAQWWRIHLPMQKMWVPSLDQEDSWRRKCQLTPVFLPGKSHGQRSLVGLQRVRCDWMTKHANFVLLSVLSIFPHSQWLWYRDKI